MYIIHNIVLILHYLSSILFILYIIYRGFRERELEDFLRVAKDGDTGFIHYEDYINLLTN